MSLREPYKTLYIPRRRYIPKLYIEVDNTRECEIEEILDLGQCQLRLEYVIKWHRYNIIKYICEIAKNLINRAKLVDSFSLIIFIIIKKVVGNLCYKKKYNLKKIVFYLFIVCL